MPALLACQRVPLCGRRLQFVWPSASGTHRDSALQPVSAQWSVSAGFPLDSAVSQQPPQSIFTSVNPSPLPGVNPWSLSPGPSLHLPQLVCRHVFRAGKCWLALIPVVNSVCLAFQAPVAALPSEVPKLPPVPTREHRSPIPLSLFFSSVFCTALFCGDYLAFSEVWALLPVFRRCPVGASLHGDVVLMCLGEEGDLHTLLLNHLESPPKKSQQEFQGVWAFFWGW